MREFKFQEGKDIKIVQSTKNDGTEYVEDGDIRLIFRDGVYVGWYMPGGARKLMVEAPTTDVVKVVRCKDCIRFVDNKEAFVTYCQRGLNNITVRPDDFCSCGEKK